MSTAQSRPRHFECPPRSCSFFQLWSLSRWVSCWAAGQLVPAANASLWLPPPACPRSSPRRRRRICRSDQMKLSLKPIKRWSRTGENWPLLIGRVPPSVDAAFSYHAPESQFRLSVSSRSLLSSLFGAVSPDASRLTWCETQKSKCCIGGPRSHVKKRPVMNHCGCVYRFKEDG